MRSPPEGFRWFSVSRHGYVCFCKVLPRKRFLPLENQKPGCHRLQNPENMRWEKKKKNGNHKPSILIDFLAPTGNFVVNGAV